MATTPEDGFTRASFALPGEREWGVVEHSDGVHFAESARERVGPFPAEAAHREAARRNEYELLIALAEALLVADGAAELRQLAGGSSYANAFDSLLGAALMVLYERGEYDKAVETERGPVVLVGRFLALAEPAGVVVREYDTPEEAELNFEVLREEG